MKRLEIVKGLEHIASGGDVLDLPTLAQEAADAINAATKEHWELMNLRKKVTAQRKEIKKLQEKATAL